MLNEKVCLHTYTCVEQRPQPEAPLRDSLGPGRRAALLLQCGPTPQFSNALSEGYCALIRRVQVQQERVLTQYHEHKFRTQKPRVLMFLKLIGTWTLRGRGRAGRACLGIHFPPSRIRQPRLLSAGSWDQDPISKHLREEL